MVPQAATLNPEAPEFIPNKLPIQPMTWHRFSQQFCYSRELRITLPPHCVYFPTVTVPLTATEAEQAPSFSIASEKDRREDGSSKVVVIRGGAGRTNGRDGFRSSMRGGFEWRKKKLGNGDLPAAHHEAEEGEKCLKSGDAPLRRVDRQRQLNAFAFTKKKRGFPVIPVRGEDTTIMIKNIPSKYSREKLVEFLENHCMVENGKEEGGNGSEDKSVLAFDFVYLPIDFRTGLNKGYAFVNFTNPKAAWKFNMTASNMKWDLFQSHKIREVVAARLQGKEKLVRHFETMHFPCDNEQVLPVCFSPPRDGVIKGECRSMGKLVKPQQLLSTGRAD